MSQDLIRTNRRVARLERERQTEAPGIWMDWTPLLGQNGVVASTRDGACRYIRIGNLIIASFRLTATAVGNVGFVINMAGLPANFLHSGARAVGSFTHYVGGAVFADGSILPLGVTDLIFNANGSTNYYGANPAVTIAIGVVTFAENVLA